MAIYHSHRHFGFSYVNSRGVTIWDIVQPNLQKWLAQTYTEAIPKNTPGKIWRLKKTRGFVIRGYSTVVSSLMSVSSLSEPFNHGTAYEMIFRIMTCLVLTWKILPIAHSFVRPTLLALRDPARSWGGGSNTFCVGEGAGWWLLTGERGQKVLN